MMRLDAETQGYLDDLATRGPAQPPATLSDVWSSSWAAAGLTTPGGLTAPRRQALDELRGAWRGAVGSDIDEEARRRNIPIDEADDDQKAATYALLSEGLPNAAQTQIRPFLDIDARARDIAAKIERDAAETSARAPGLSGAATAWLAGVARTAVDPQTLAVSAGVALLTPETAGLAPFLAREAFINAATTAAVQPGVNVAREDMGLAPAPLGESLIESAIGGAAIGGLLRGAGVAARRMWGREPARPDLVPEVGKKEMTPAAREAFGALEPEDYELAARHLDNRDLVDRQALRPDAAGVADHGRALDAAAAALERGDDPAGGMRAPDQGASEIATAIDVRAAQLSPRVFARAGELDQRIASARAEIERITARPEPDALAGRIAQLEGELSQITGKRRSSPRAKALRAELEDYRSQARDLIDQQQAMSAEQLSVLRLSIVDLQSRRALLGPKIRAVRAHAAKAMGVDNLDAVLIAAARDERAAMAIPDRPPGPPAIPPVIPIDDMPRPPSNRPTPVEPVTQTRTPAEPLPPPVALEPPPVAPEPPPVVPPPVAPPRALSDYPLPAPDSPPPPSAAPSTPPEPPATVVRTKRRTVREFPTLFEALAAEGGLAPDPELAAIFDGNPFVPGFGRLVRAGGRTLDDALTAAKELGYLYDPNDAPGAGALTLSQNDLLDLLRRESHGEKIYSLNDMDAMAERDARRAAREFEKEHKAALRRLRKEDTLQPRSEEGVVYWTPDENILSIAAMRMVDDPDLAPIDAWDRAAVEYERDLWSRSEQIPGIHEARHEDTGDIDGWDIPFPDEIPGKAADAPQGGGAVARTSDGAAGQSAGAAETRGGTRVDGGNDRAVASPLLSEPGAEGLPQTLIPGVAPVTDRARADLLAARPLRGGDAPAGGLFDQNARNQTDLFDASQLPDAPAQLSALRAEAERAIAEAGDQPFQFTDDVTGETRLVRPSDLLAELDDDAAAASEFLACLGGAAEEAS